MKRFILFLPFSCCAWLQVAQAQIVINTTNNNAAPVPSFMLAANTHANANNYSLVMPNNASFSANADSENSYQYFDAAAVQMVATATSSEPVRFLPAAMEVAAVNVGDMGNAGSARERAEEWGQLRKNERVKESENENKGNRANERKISSHTDGFVVSAASNKANLTNSLPTSQRAVPMLSSVAYDAQYSIPNSNSKADMTVNHAVVSHAVINHLSANNVIANETGIHNKTTTYTAHQLAQANINAQPTRTTTNRINAVTMGQANEVKETLPSERRQVGQNSYITRTPVAALNANSTPATVHSAIVDLIAAPATGKAAKVTSTAANTVTKTVKNTAANTVTKKVKNTAANTVTAPAAMATPSSTITSVPKTDARIRASTSSAPMSSALETKQKLNKNTHRNALNATKTAVQTESKQTTETKNTAAQNAAAQNTETKTAVQTESKQTTETKNTAAQNTAAQNTETKNTAVQTAPLMQAAVLPVKLATKAAENSSAIIPTAVAPSSPASLPTDNAVNNKLDVKPASASSSTTAANITTANAITSIADNNSTRAVSIADSHLTTPLASTTSLTPVMPIALPSNALHINSTAIAMAPAKPATVTFHITPTMGYLSHALNSFARENGWTVAWTINRDFPIDFSAAFTGDFLSVIEQVVDSLSQTDTPIRVKVYEANQVIRVVYGTS